MARKTEQMTEALYEFMITNGTSETSVQRELREYTATLPQAHLQIAPEQAQFMALVARMINAKRALEIGVYTGYSALAVALALPEDGELIACDIDAAMGAIAQQYWQAAGVAHKMRLIIAPAEESVAELAAARAGQFDMIFIDANKLANEYYYEHALTLLRPGGVVLVDNVFCHGAVAQPVEKIPRVTAQFCTRVNDDERVHSTIVPIADGLLMALKR